MSEADFAQFAAEMFGCWVIGFGSGFLIKFVTQLMEKV